ncbi:MAG: bifunctional farnesyl-diphosphate farnesyltransferase/squalene synthase [Piccolia ochrophora]|nr:MAG: bifunctional farnesyl-diphosphate farnesyltransferase/squalene synthase [Piccolia ochrophora]
MSALNSALYYLFHTQELRSIVQWKVWHDAVHTRDPDKETATQRRCFEYLEKTSRSFSAVIQELHPELLLPVALFYLILRGIDTIEDDMTIALEEKDPLLRDFHQILDKPGWTYEDNGPNEKDRDLLVHFDTVIEEFEKVNPAYREIIQDITHKMGDGMADYAKLADQKENRIDTVEGYDLYCHYVAGLVGEGLTRLFVQSKLANPALLQRPHLQESMGLFLQKTNIIRDVREDSDDNRFFWPKEIWSKHVSSFEELFDGANQQAALNCSSEMVLNALNHADECLFYLAGIKEQSVFNFTAIPQSMAIATLDLVFRNPLIFQKNVKISKGEACRLMLQSTQNLQTVCGIFREYARSIHKKNTPQDPNYLEISISCGKIEQFIESIFPSQDPQAIALEQTGKPGDPRKAKEDADAREAKMDLVYTFGAVLLLLIFLTVVMLGVAYLAGARFDIAISELRQGKFSRPGSKEADTIRQGYDRREL